ncbi:MAG: hypothetical protein Q8O25_02635 [Sulfurisoma sp.]|nr:hypothetical protein [Sulfurisoma sp.]
MSSAIAAPAGEMLVAVPLPPGFQACLSLGVQALIFRHVAKGAALTWSKGSREHSKSVPTAWQHPKPRNPNNRAARRPIQPGPFRVPY